MLGFLATVQPAMAGAAAWLPEVAVGVAGLLDVEALDPVAVLWAAPVPPPGL